MNVTETVQIQLELQSKISLKDKIDINNIKSITGVDVAYFMINNKEYAVCYAVTLDRNTHEMLEYTQEYGVIEIPYTSGLLAFREKDLILGAWKKLKKKGNVIVFDGNGILHERKMGIATHVGTLLDMPTIGVAKTFYDIHGIDYPVVGNRKFDATDIEYKGFVYGKALRTRPDCKPVIISSGTNISLDTAVCLLKEFVTDDSRIPLPTRLADIGTHAARKTLLK